MANIHAINAQGTEYGITAENGITQAQAIKIETIGDVARLTTVAKQTVVEGVNEVNDTAYVNKANIGDLDELITSSKSTLVNAINSAQGVLDNILESYGKNVTSSISDNWKTDINTKVNEQSQYTYFTVYSQSDLEGFLTGWKKSTGDVHAIFMYGTIAGVAFRRGSAWSFYSILNATL